MLTAASGVLVSLMDGFRRAYGIPNPWGFWRERIMAFLLIPLSLLPMAFATVLVAFGNQVENWLSLHTWYELRPLVVVSWRAVLLEGNKWPQPALLSDKPHTA